MTRIDAYEDRSVRLKIPCVRVAFLRKPKFSTHADAVKKLTVYDQHVNLGTRIVEPLTGPKAGFLRYQSAPWKVEVTAIADFAPSRIELLQSGLREEMSLSAGKADSKTLFDKGG